MLYLLYCRRDGYLLLLLSWASSRLRQQWRAQDQREGSRAAREFAWPAFKATYATATLARRILCIFVRGGAQLVWWIFFVSSPVALFPCHAADGGVSVHAAALCAFFRFSTCIPFRNLHSSESHNEKEKTQLQGTTCPATAQHPKVPEEIMRQWRRQDTFAINIYKSRRHLQNLLF